MFRIQASGTEPLNYQWQHKTGDGSGEWESCDVESFPGANSSTLTILTVQKLKEGSYRCTVNNLAGSETSECATLTLGELTACTLLALFSGPKRMHMHCVLHNLTLIDESSTLQVLSYVLAICTFHVSYIVSIVLVSCVVIITTESCMFCIFTCS